MLPACQERGEGLGGGVRQGTGLRADDLGEAGPQVGVERIRLGEMADRLGEVADLARIADRGRQPAGRLQHHQLGAAGAEALDHPADAGRVMRQALVRAGRAHGEVQVRFGHVDAHEDSGGHDSLLSPDDSPDAPILG